MMTADNPMNHKLIISLHKETDPTQDTTILNTHAKPIMHPLLPHLAEALPMVQEHMAEVLLAEVEEVQGVAEHLILPTEDPTMVPQLPPEITMTDLSPLSQEESIQISDVSYAIRTTMSWIVPELHLPADNELSKKEPTDPLLLLLLLLKPNKPHHLRFQWLQTQHLLKLLHKSLTTGPPHSDQIQTPMVHIFLLLMLLLLFNLFLL
jgi:hypothetical protein